jgi:hypothetical protein
MLLMARSGWLLAAALSTLAALAQAADEDLKITIKSARYGDLPANKTCTPDLSLCNGRSECSFMIADSLCQVPRGAGSARNLEVFFSCGKKEPKGVAGAQDTRMKLIKCP